VARLTKAEKLRRARKARARLARFVDLQSPHLREHVLREWGMNPGYAALSHLLMARHEIQLLIQELQKENAPYGKGGEAMKYEAAMVNCQMALLREPHNAELSAGGEVLLHAAHGGAWYWACAEHSGICHEGCWPARLYPDLRPRIAPQEEPCRS
jgi:hypothetical protein